MWTEDDALWQCLAHARNTENVSPFFTRKTLANLPEQRQNSFQGHLTRAAWLSALPLGATAAWMLFFSPLSQSVPSHTLAVNPAPEDLALTEVVIEETLARAVENPERFTNEEVATLLLL